MGNKVIDIPIYKIREIARHALKNNWKKVVAGIFICFLLTDAVGAFLDYFFAYEYPVELYDGTISSTKIGFGGSLYSLILGGPLQFGLAMFVLTFFRTRKSDYTLLLEGFSNFSRTFTLALLIGIKTLLWSLLFVIPGIIAAYKYSQSYYLLVENPTWTPSQCIRESCRIMEGNKATLFVLELSFIGWGLLASIPEFIYMVVVGADAALNAGTLGGIITDILLRLPGLFVTAYTLVSYTAFYDLITGRLVAINDYEPENVVHAEYTVEENPQTEETDFHEE